MNPGVLVAGTLKTPLMNSHDTAETVANNMNKCVVRSSEHETEYKI